VVCDQKGLAAPNKGKITSSPNKAGENKISRIKKGGACKEMGEKENSRAKGAVS